MNAIVGSLSVDDGVIQSRNQDGNIQKTRHILNIDYESLKP